MSGDDIFWGACSMVVVVCIAVTALTITRSCSEPNVSVNVAADEKTLAEHERRLNADMEAVSELDTQQRIMRARIEALEKHNRDPAVSDDLENLQEQINMLWGQTRHAHLPDGGCVGNGCNGHCLLHEHDDPACREE